jgi:CMP-N-acetylneuraminic acid synthetase
VSNACGQAGAIGAAASRCFAEHNVFVDEQTVAYVMPVERSIDIDNPEDLIVAEAVLRRHKAALDQ